MQEPEQEVKVSAVEPKSPRRGGGVLLATIALTIAILSLAFQFFSWQLHKNAMTKVLSENQQMESRLVLTLQNLQGKVAQQEKSLNNLLTQTGVEGRKKVLFSAEEAKHLITLAQYNLLFENNSELAAKLLAQADQKLQEINDSGLLSVRKEIGNAIIALNTVARVDVTGLMSRLNAMSAQVNNLSLLPSSTATAKPAPAAHKTTTWKEKFFDTLENLRGIISIRRLKESVQPLPSPEHYLYVIETIRLQLSAAQWAVLHQDATLYQVSLKRAKEDLQKYFGKTATGISLIQVLTQLQEINVKPTVPDLSTVITLLQNYITNAQQNLINKPTENVSTSGAINSTNNPIPRALPS